LHTVFPYNIVSVNFCGTDNSFTIIPGTKYLVYWARFVYDREAHILTNDHVVRNAAYVVVTLVDGNPGNSGGILVNMQGKVIGMNTATINSQLGGSTSLGFAIPSKTLLREVPDIIKKGTYPHPWLGLSAITLTSDLNEAAGLKPNFRGIIVDSLAKDGPANKAGIHGRNIDEFLQVHGGDIITAF
jgi:S1-C subfamily serine protease